MKKTKFKYLRHFTLGLLVISFALTLTSVTIPEVIEVKAEEEGLAATPVKLEMMQPQIDASKGEAKLFADVQKDVYNPETVPITVDGWKMDYSVGRRLYQRGDFKRAAMAFKTALLELDGLPDSDSRVQITKKAMALANGLTTESGRLGYQTNNKNPKALTGRVTKVFPPSLAWLAGLKAGDTVLKANVDKGAYRLTIRRAGKLKVLRLNSERPELAPRENLKARARRDSLQAKAVKSKAFPRSEKILADYDCCLLVDCSGSMMSPMAPGTGYEDYTRWKWCGEQSYDFMSNANQYFPRGISVIPFNHQFSVRDNVKLNDISDLYDTVKPFGQTKIEKPLSYVLSRYFAKRRSGYTKPLSITVLTDGIANLQNIGDVIIAATQEMKEKREIVITFLEVDEAYKGEEILDSLDNRLVDAGARYDIVHVIGFQNLLAMGLKRAIVSTLISAQN